MSRTAGDSPRTRPSPSAASWARRGITADPNDAELTIVLSKPLDTSILDNVSKMLNEPVKPALASRTAITAAIDVAYEQKSTVIEEVAEEPSLIKNLVEEIIRMESPFRWMPRTAMQDTTIRGTHIPKGSDLLVMIGAANRDERRFENPDHFDLHRDTSGHLGFGYGIHFCLGASLARLETRVVLETLVPLLLDL